MRRVVIFQYRLLHYRIGLFDLLRERCRANDIELHLVHGQPTRREQLKNDVGNLAWADLVTNHYWEVGARDWVWQPLPVSLRDADLVVVMQENRLLSNYPLLLSRLWANRKVAYWGHGANFQSEASQGLRERWKRLLLTRVDWWFAYTQLTADMVIESGYPLDRITCLNNAIDTNAFRRELAAVTDSALVKEREALDISSSAPVGLFCGSLYPDKRLEFLVDAVDRIHAEAPDFHCIVLGDGPSMPLMREAAATRSWLHLLGVKKGAEKAVYFRLADFMLNPGLVGLHIVDAFCAALVILTTSNAKHSPEIAYLRHGENGFMTGDSTVEYTQAVLRLIHDTEQLGRIKAAALADAERYTLGNMVERFADGIKRCLAMPKK